MGKVTLIFQLEVQTYSSFRVDSIRGPTPFPRGSRGPVLLRTATSSSGRRLAAGILSLTQNSNSRERALLPETL